MLYKPNILLCCSSGCFLLTSLYGYKKQQYMYQFDLLSACCSLMYWADPTNTYKRIADITTAILLPLFFLSTCIKIQKAKYVIACGSM